MASPFKFFRKNQKAALAVLTVVAMGGFVVLPTVVQMMGGGGNQAAARRPVVTTTRYGDLDAATMAGMRRDRQMVRGFLSRVETLVRMKQQNWRTATVAQTLQMRLSIEDQAIVETWLLVKRAEELGVVVDDAAVNSFIEQITEGVVTGAELVGTGGEDKGLLGDIDLPENQLFRLLKYELMAMRLQDLVFTGLLPMTPGERWDYYQRLHRNMSIEFTEVPAERFVAAVSDPDDATLKKFFDRFKDKENVPQSTEPGFRVPKRIAVEYFKVDYDRLFEPGELEKYYEENKEEFKREKLPDTEPSDPASELKGSLPGLDGPQLELPPIEGAAPEMEGGPSSETQAAKPEPEEKPAEKPEPAEAKGDAPKPEQAKPEEAASEVPEKKADDAPKATDESQTIQRSVFQLTAYQADEEAENKPAEETKSEEEKAEEKPAEEKKAEEKKAEEKKAEEKKAEEKPAEPKQEQPKSDETTEQSEPAEQMPVDKKLADKKLADEKPVESADAGKPDTPSALAEDVQKFEPPLEYYTFEEVKSQIQNRLAPDKLEQLFRPLENQMTLYHDAQIRYIRVQDDEGNSSVPPPVKLDFAKLAADAGIEAKKTDLFSQREAVKLDLDIARSTITLGDRPAEFLSYAFDSIAELSPARSQDRDGNHYLFWKTEQESERVPELDDEGVRAMVSGAWKMIQSREAAQTEADRLAAVARDKEKASEEPVTLATALAAEPEIAVEATEPFTWFDEISIQLTTMGYGQPRLSTIELVAPEPEDGEEPAEAETVPLVGTDFMRTVASLDKGSVGVAWNQPKTVAYVVRMLDTTPDAKELQGLFLAAANPQQIGIVASIDRRDAFREWVKSLEAAVGLEWQ